MIAADLKRFKRMAAQGVPLPAATLEAMAKAEAEDLTGADDDDAGNPGEVHRVADAEHAHDCPCHECDADRSAVGVDCGEFEHGARYREAVFVTKGAARYRSRRATNAEPGASDDWEAVGRAPTAPPARTKAKAAPPVWLKALVGELRDWVNERLEPLVRRVAAIETKAGGTGSGAELGDVVARLDALEARLTDGARSWAASNLADAFCGTFTDGTRYERGSLVVFGGSLWLSLRDVDGAQRPGKTDAWRLVTKHGRDAAREPR